MPHSPALQYRKNDHRHSNLMATLDLHGKTKPQALRALTDFLEVQARLCRELSSRSSRSPVVRVVTGTGSHSSVGPVLRTAVLQVLTRRRMTFTRETPGSFLVDPTTGIVWERRASTEEDTKVIVRERGDTGEEPWQDLNSLGGSSHHSSSNSSSVGGVMLRATPTGPAFDRKQFMGPQTRANAMRNVYDQIRFELGHDDDTRPPPPPPQLSGPSIVEVARETRDLEQAYQNSMVHQQSEARRRRVDESQLNRALKASEEEWHEEESDYEKLINDAIQVSQQEFSEREMSERLEEDQLHQVIQESLHMPQPTASTGDEQLLEEEEEELRWALEQSLAQTSQPQPDEEEEERMIQAAMAMSLQT